MSDFDDDVVVIDDDEEVVVSEGQGFFEDEDQEKEIAKYICEQLELSEQDRAQRLDKIEKYRKQRLADTGEYSGGPWPGSARMTVPLSMWISDTMYGHIEGVFGERKPQWDVKSLRDEEGAQEVAEFGGKYLNMLSESKNDLDWPRTRREIESEISSLGTCFTKVVWDNVDWRFMNGEGELVIATLRDGPRIIPIAEEDFYYRASCKEIGTAPLVADRFYLPKNVFQNRLQAGYYDEGDVVLEFDKGSVPDDEAERDRNVSLEQSDHDMIELFEVYVFWDVNGDGFQEDCRFLFHRDTETFVKAEFNSVGYRPYVSNVFKKVAGQLVGVGTCQATEGMQDEVDALHRIRIDNLHITTNRVYKVRRASHLMPNIKVGPGKLIPMDDPVNDMIPLNQNDNYNSSIQEENMAVNYAQRGSGVSEVMAGFSDSTMKTQDTVGGQVLRLQQGKGVVASTIQDLQDSFSDLGYLVFLLLVANKDRVLENEREKGRLTEEELQKLEVLLSVRLEDVPQKFSFRVRTTDLTQTTETKRQNFMTLMQLLTMSFQQTMPLAMQLYGPEGQQMPPAIRDVFTKAFAGQSRLLEQVIEFFGIENEERFVPDYKKAEMLNELMAAMQQMQGGLNGQGIPGQPMGGQSGGGQPGGGVQPGRGGSVQGNGGQPGVRPPQGGNARQTGRGPTPVR